MYQINRGTYVHYIEFTPSIDNCVSLQIKTHWTDNLPYDIQNKFHVILTKQEMIDLGNQLIERATSPDLEM